MENVSRWAGIDWGDCSHALAIVDVGGHVVVRRSIEHSAKGLDELVALLAEHGPVAGVAIERKRHLVIDRLLVAAQPVYPINPKVSKQWRECFSVDPAKTDAADGLSLANGLHLCHGQFQPLRLDDPPTRELRLLCETERRFIADRTALGHRLKDCLKQYFPQALGWFAKFTGSTAADFVIAFPAPEALRSASDQDLVKFLRAHHIGLRPWWRKRLASRTAEPQWVIDPATIAAKSVEAVGIARQLRTLALTLKDLRRRIDARFADHEDASLFLSLPGASTKLAARLAAYFGSDRDRYESAESVLALSGSVPVTKRSGKGGGDLFRWACQKGFRTTVWQFAYVSRRQCAWAAAYYKMVRARGKTHAAAVRSLGAKWLKIIYRLWKTRTAYDERIYMASLVRHRSPLVAWMREAENPEKTGENP